MIETNGNQKADDLSMNLKGEKHKLVPEVQMKTILLKINAIYTITNSSDKQILSVFIYET